MEKLQIMVRLCGGKLLSQFLNNWETMIFWDVPKMLKIMYEQLSMKLFLFFFFFVLFPLSFFEKTAQVNKLIPACLQGKCQLNWIFPWNSHVTPSLPLTLISRNNLYYSVAIDSAIIYCHLKCFVRKGKKFKNSWRKSGQIENCEKYSNFTICSIFSIKIGNS